MGPYLTARCPVSLVCVGIVLLEEEEDEDEEEEFEVDG